MLLLVGAAEKNELLFAVGGQASWIGLITNEGVCQSWLHQPPTGDDGELYANEGPRVLGLG